MHPILAILIATAVAALALVLAVALDERVTDDDEDI